MLKISARILALAALGLAVAAPRPSHAALADNHVDVTNWSHAYVLTPLEQKRLRTYGLKDIEIYVIANAATQSWRDVDDLVQLYLVHPRRSVVMNELNLDFKSLLKVHPEWNTPEWQEAVKRGDYTWIPPQAPAVGDGAKTGSAKVKHEEKEAAR